MVRPENNSKLLKWIGGILFGFGIVVMTGYGMYAFCEELFGHSDTPIALQVALPATVIGLVVLLIAVVKDRMKHGKDEDLKEVKY